MSGIDRRPVVLHRFAWLLVAAALGSHAVTSAQSPRPLALVGEIAMGTVDRVAVDGAQAVVLHGPRLATVGLDDDGSPRLQGTSEVLPAPVGDVAVLGDLALVGAGELQVFDLSNRDRPTVLGTLDIVGRRVEVDLAFASDRAVVLGDALHVVDFGTPASATVLGSAAVTGRAVALDGVARRAYVAADAEGVHLVDLSDPTAPRPISRFPDTRAWGVAAAGGLVFVADPDAGLRILDWRDPAAPVQIALFELPADACSQGSSRCPFAQDVVLDDDRLHVTFGRGISAFSSRDPGLVMTLDITEPHAPREIGRRALEGLATDLALGGADLWLAERPLWWYAGIAACQMRGGGLLQLDDGLALTHRLAPPIAVNALTSEGERLLGADVTPLRVRAWDVGDPTSPTLLERPGARGFGSSYGSAEARDIALTAAGPAVALAGQTMGFLQVAGNASSSTSAASAAGTSARPSALLNGCAPPSSSQWFTRIEPHGAGVALLDAAGRLRLYDADVPARSPIGSYEDLAATDLAVDGDLVHLVGPAGYEIVDVSDRTWPVPQGSLDLAGRAIALDDDRVFVGTETGLTVLDVQDPRSPTILGQTTMAAPIDDVLVAGSHVYVASGGTVRAFSIAGDGTAAEVAHVESPEGVRRLHAAGAHLYTVDRGGVSILALLEGDRVDPATSRPPAHTPSPSPTVTATVTPGPSPTPGLLLPIGLRGAGLR